MYDNEGFEDDGTTARLIEVMLFPKDTDFKVVWSKNNFNNEPSCTTLPSPSLNWWKSSDRSPLCKVPNLVSATPVLMWAINVTPDCCSFSTTNKESPMYVVLPTGKDSAMSTAVVRAACRLSSSAVVSDGNEEIAIRDSN